MCEFLLSQFDNFVFHDRGRGREEVEEGNGTCLQFSLIANIIVYFLFIRTYPDIYKRQSVHWRINTKICKKHFLWRTTSACPHIGRRKKQ